MRTSYSIMTSSDKRITRVVTVRREGEWEAQATMLTRSFGLEFSVSIGVDVGDKYWGSVTRIEVVC